MSSGTRRPPDAAHALVASCACAEVVERRSSAPTLTRETTWRTDTARDWRPFGAALAVGAIYYAGAQGRPGAHLRAVSPLRSVAAERPAVRRVAAGTRSLVVAAHPRRFPRPPARRVAERRPGRDGALLVREQRQRSADRCAVRAPLRRPVAQPRHRARACSCSVARPVSRLSFFLPRRCLRAAGRVGETLDYWTLWQSRAFLRTCWRR